MKMINIKKTDENAKTPTYGSEFAAGADLYAVIHNYVGLIYARSGLACKQGLALANKVGVIDSDYRGNIMVALYNQSSETRIVSEGDRIAQIIIQPVEQFGFNEKENLSGTKRGENGFGSTGKR